MKHPPETSRASAPWRLLEQYQFADGVYDEMAAAPDALRPHCEVFARSLESLGHDELGRAGKARGAISATTA